MYIYMHARKHTHISNIYIIHVCLCTRAFSLAYSKVPRTSSLKTNVALALQRSLYIPTLIHQSLATPGQPQHSILVNATTIITNRSVK